MAEHPNPGSPEAVERGCTCPVIDNHYGEGTPHRDGPRFWINWKCDLHAALCFSDREPGR